MAVDASLRQVLGDAAGTLPRNATPAALDRLRAEIVLLEEELEIKDARWGRVPARRRPHYGAVQRMRIGAR